MHDPVGTPLNSTGSHGVLSSAKNGPSPLALQTSSRVDSTDGGFGKSGLHRMVDLGRVDSTGGGFGKSVFHRWWVREELSALVEGSV